MLFSASPFFQIGNHLHVESMPFIVCHQQFHAADHFLCLRNLHKEQLSPQTTWFQTVT